jgi:hypothetical protein
MASWCECAQAMVEPSMCNGCERPLRGRSEMADPYRPRSLIEEEMEAARQDLEIAEDDVQRANDEIAFLESELDALPPEDGADEDLWHARHDPRQLPLFP